MDSTINNACKFGSDAWLELQAFKTRQLNRREKLNRHKNLHKDLINGIVLNHQYPQNASTTSTLNSALLGEPKSPALPGTSKAKSSLSNTTLHTLSSSVQEGLQENIKKYSNSLLPGDDEDSNTVHDSSTKYLNSSSSKSTLNDSASNLAIECTSGSSDTADSHQSVNLELVECLLLLKLCDVALKLPIDSKSLQKSVCKIRGFDNTTRSLIENLLQKFAHQELITIDESNTATINHSKHQNVGASEIEFDESCIYVTSADHTKLVEFDKSIGSFDGIRAVLLDSKNDDLACEELFTLSNHNSVQTVRNSLYQIQRDEGKSAETKNINIISDLSSQDKLSSQTSNSLSKNNSFGFSQGSKQYGDDLESLLLLSSTKERESKKLGEELLELLSKPTAKERNLLERFRSADGYQVQEFCAKGTKGECSKNNKGAGSCSKLHFKKIIAKHTEESLGDCSFLNTCFHMDSCKYVHYQVDYDEQPPKHQFKRPHKIEFNIKRNSSRENLTNSKTTLEAATTVKAPNECSNDCGSNKLLPTTICLAGPPGSVAKYTLSPEEQARIDAKNRKRFKTVLYPPQWIQCDLRFFDMSLLGKFSVVMADPPWDIHMELPYGTMSDDEMRKLNIPGLQDEGVIFLWVTGRAMELGRECLALWGYERCDEIIWVKTNQLQRIIRTGRTGHWLNHGKEHCLVGVKGNPEDINRGLDCDVIVAEVRATSHKPDEIYGIIERLSPGTRKIELFGRAHNVQPNWITLGNQLNGVRLIEPNLVNAFKKLNLPFQTTDHIAQK